MLFEVFDDLTNQQLKSIIKQYNHHLKIVYSKLNRDELLKVIHEHFDIDNEKIKLKRIEPIYFNVPEKKVYKRKSKMIKPYKLIDYNKNDLDDEIKKVNEIYDKSKKFKIEKNNNKSKNIRYDIDDYEFSDDLNDDEKEYFDNQQKEREQRYKEQRARFLKSAFDKDDWKTFTKQEKEIVCNYMYDIDKNEHNELKLFPKHLIDYYNKYCKHNFSKLKMTKSKMIK